MHHVAKCTNLVWDNNKSLFHFIRASSCGRIIRIQNALKFSVTDRDPNLHGALFLSTSSEQQLRTGEKESSVCLLQHEGWAGETGYCCIQVLRCGPVLEPGQVMWNSDNGNLEHMEIQLALHICHAWVSPHIHIRTTDAGAAEVLSSALFRAEIPQLTLHTHAETCATL